VPTPKPDPQNPGIPSHVSRYRPGDHEIAMAPGDFQKPDMFDHETAHGIDFALSKGGRPWSEADPETHALLNKLRAGGDARRGKGEDYAAALAARKKMERLFTPEDIKSLRGPSTIEAGTWAQGLPQRPDLGLTGGAHSDLMQSYNPELGDEEVADILNKISLQQPKTSRGEPTQSIGESQSLMERIDAVLDETIIVPTRNEIVDFISENPNQEIHLDSPKGSRKAFGQGKKNKVELPFDYGEYPDIINPADNMGWDIIIVPSATQNQPNLIPVGHVAYSKDRPDKVGNDKIIVAPDGNYGEVDQEIINDFFEGLDGFEPIRWY